MGSHAAQRRKQKKEEFPSPMENMRPGNSFPQICVVSVNEYVGNKGLIKDHGRSVYVSNQTYGRW